MIRGKDALVFAKPPPGEAVAGRTEVLFDLQVCTCHYIQSLQQAVPSPTELVASRMKLLVGLFEWLRLSVLIDTGKGRPFKAVRL